MSQLQLRASDGKTLSAYVSKPEGAIRGGIVVIQEIFGVTGHIERVADQFSAQGYLAIAPALFDRQQKGVNLPYDEDGVQRGMAFARNADTAGLKADIEAAIAAVDRAGAVGMVGYCWGGRVVYLAGSRTNIAAGVVYYGGGIPAVLEPVPRCPMQFHFGEHDKSIPLSDVAAIRAAFPQGEYHLYDAGHGFNCPARPSFDAKASHLAFERTLQFFREHVG